MEKVLLRPLQTEVEYRGQYAALAFRLLSNPVPVYEGLLQTLGGFGASLRDLRYDATNLQEANISCGLLNFNAVIRVRLDRLEVTFLTLDKVTVDTAQQIVINASKAVKLADESVLFAQHSIAVASQCELSGVSYNALLRRYVTIPSNLGAQTASGLVFYLGQDPLRGEKGGSILLERSIVKEGGLYLKVTVVFDASKVEIESLAGRVDEYFTRQLGSLGLEMERVDQR